MIVRSVSHDVRRASLRERLELEGFVRLLEAHDPLSAMVGENATAVLPEVGHVEFDGFWSSSLTDSARRGLPDIELVGMRSRLQGIAEMFAVTSKPLLMDGDTGGRVEHFEYTVRDLERAGVSGVVIEDKTGLKQNSLLGTSVPQLLETVEAFSEKIARGKAAQSRPEFMIVARIESLILGMPMDDALHRASAYVSAGADAVMIHSRQSSPREVLAFAALFRAAHPTVPLVAVPTTYNTIRAEDLRAAGFNVVIYANHMLRASLRAMDAVARKILNHDRTLEVEPACADLKDLLTVEVESGRAVGA
ncbi:phosphoenolpyruvate mutase [Cellulomonas sp. Leaf334]|uniref:phosphoenolpyruvate mutase n=1 Tax=Cellulomonas sp. Leaf334 TaxID=1736339 RepID=UPI0006FF08CD|nr:phosphoenolpyruvate mutase [Cellulomonas sp. Leaf334]KQR11676.1 hypothetical protein ASF78_10550 [Cellulomonas sp. Leaf334]